MMQTLSRYLMAVLCMLTTGTWILPVHTLAAPVPMPVSHGGDDGEVAVEVTSAVAVESVEDVVLLPKQVIPCEPVPAEEFFVVIASQVVPEDAIAPLGVSDLGPVDSSAVAPLQIRVGLCSVAVAFVREGETTMRFGYGVQSTVVVTTQSQSSGALARAEAFQLVAETPTPNDAVDGAQSLWCQVAQPPFGDDFPYYSTCVGLCMREVHDRWWSALADCFAVMGTVVAAASSLCVFNCMRSPAPYKCIVACLTAIGIPLGVLSSTGAAACVAGYIAMMTAALAVCSVGCIW